MNDVLAVLIVVALYVFVVWCDWEKSVRECREYLDGLLGKGRDRV